MNSLRKAGCTSLTGVLLASILPLASAQEIHFDTGSVPNAAPTQRVTLDSNDFTVEAGKPNWIELRFHIAPGLHINSHDPRDETLIPTSFKMEPAPNLRLLHVEFPPGIPYRLATGAGETLSTYQGDLRLGLQIDNTGKGDAVLTGKLRYQACDNASCFPPRDLPLQLTLHVR